MLTGKLRKLMVGLATLSSPGLASTWGLGTLEARLAPWKEDVRGWDRALGLDRPPVLVSGGVAGGHAA